MPLPALALLAVGAAGGVIVSETVEDALTTKAPQGSIANEVQNAVKNTGKLANTANNTLKITTGALAGVGIVAIFLAIRRLL